MNNNKLINPYKIDYPYIKYIYKKNKKQIFQMIKTFTPIIHYSIPIELKNKDKFVKYNDEYIFIEENWIKYIDLNCITDLFTEKIRIKCCFGNHLSPYEYWKLHHKQIINKTKEIYKNNEIKYIRETIYNKTKLCSNFRISLCLTILMIFKPKKWLDISAGWGDRLLSAIFYNYIADFDLYYATDPNRELHPCYKKIIDTFVEKKDKHKFNLIISGFENYKFPVDDFDIVFSSPPFFDLEKYSSFDGDSITLYNTEDTWAKNFLKPSLINAYNHLKIMGHLILYIYTSDLVNKYLDRLNNLMKYIGNIHSFDYNDKKKTVRIIFVWKKIKNDKINNL